MEAVEGLVIALGDNDRDVRYEAVIGLAELTGQNQWAPSIGKFESDEQHYLDYLTVLSMPESFFEFPLNRFSFTAATRVRFPYGTPKL